MDFFRNKVYQLTMLSTTLIVVGIFVYFARIPDYKIFPNKHEFRIDFYTDSANGGHSQITFGEVSDSLIDVGFNLKEGFLSPYIGLLIAPNKAKIHNLSQYNQLSIEVEGYQTNSIGISVFTQNVSSPINDAGKNDMCFQTNLDIASQRQRYNIDIDKFKVPDWWSEVNHISRDEKLQPHLLQFLHLNIGNVYTSNLGPDRSLKIYSITFTRDNRYLATVLCLVELMVAGLLLAVHFLKRILNRKAAPVTIAYKPVDLDTPKPRKHDFLDYINNNFHNTELTLDLIADDTGVNQRKIAATIQETFGCNVKTYINQIRINESKRLLKETDLSIGEIAFKVGFNNQTHFNRVFKSMVDMSPSEFKDHTA
jgi:AraC-like DNA-binding protein